VLASVSSDLAEEFEILAFFVDRILRGTRTSDLPVQHPSKFEVYINRRTAAKLGVVIPRSVEVSATRIVECRLPAGVRRNWKAVARDRPEMAGSVSTKPRSKPSVDFGAAPHAFAHQQPSSLRPMRRATRGFIDPFSAPRNCVVISRPASCRRYSQRQGMLLLLRGHWLRDGIQRSKRRYC